ncbi:hypothetical protein MRB53_030011 [Persea americana]|uniref:Uncharacterized protein n=1 Tax=Persea americana TaxID=3435 RepID=A0ACC2KL20_PERAE|nr:hypothetical protein MRB53_030011 [Persea americana]
MLSSACPGWICYAEKTLGSYILPYISSVKSPQQAIGATIKHHICHKMGLKPDKVYHVTVMPCYDKKLEAARDDLVFSVEHQEETVNEASGRAVAELNSINLKSLEEAPLDKLLMNVDEGHLYGVSGSSGGYAETIFRHAAKSLFGKEIKGPIDFKILWNSDFRELSLEVEGETVLRFALCYGFRNLQNIVMACPSGCLNGGGQIKPKEGQSAKDVIQSLEGVYLQDNLYDEWLGQPGSEQARKHIHTQYHLMVKSIAAQLHNW